MSTPKLSAAPPVFLDRDGTLIVEKGYLRDPEDVILEKGVVQGLTMLAANGHALIVLSNQSGIGRGRLTHGDAQRVNARTAELLRNAGIEILAWYFCPHAPGEGCNCRKPAAGMAQAASRDLEIDLVGSYVVGDKRSDLELADAIDGVGILVTTGHGEASVSWAIDRSHPVFGDFAGAAKYIVDTQRNFNLSP